jgi:hypothetical protein
LAGEKNFSVKDYEVYIINFRWFYLLIASKKEN